MKMEMPEKEFEQIQNKLKEVGAIIVSLSGLEALRKENEDLKAKLDKAKDALRFYADESEHTSCEFDYNTDGEKYYPRGIFHDRGQRARTTLEEI